MIQLLGSLLSAHLTHQPTTDLQLQEVFKAVQQFVQEIQAGGPVQKGTDAQSQADKPTTKTAVSVASTSSTAPSQVLHLHSISYPNSTVQAQPPTPDIQALPCSSCTVYLSKLAMLGLASCGAGKSPPATGWDSWGEGGGGCVCQGNSRVMGGWG